MGDLDPESSFSSTVGNLVSFEVTTTGSPIIMPKSSESTEADLLLRGSMPSSEASTEVSSNGGWSPEAAGGLFEKRTRLTEEGLVEDAFPVPKHDEL